MGRLLITGGAGYIGSHTCVALLNAGHELTVLDNLSNSNRAALDAVRRITNRPLTFIEGDLRQPNDLDTTFNSETFDGVVHFAGLKAIGESVERPLAYFENNVTGTINLLEAMTAHEVKTIVFSSSATVYGDPASVPIDESFPTGATNPYGRTKLMIEEILKDVYAADPSWRISILRYFNPVGAHASGELGEDPMGTPSNLMPYLAQVAIGQRPHLNVFGNDYPTPDGTGVRDYIHVADLATGHLAALEFLKDQPKLAIHNLGTGKGYSVLEALAAFEKASGKDLPFKVVERRPGDIAECYADSTRAQNELEWKPQYGLDEMCADAWRWQQRYPQGFPKDSD